MNYGNYNSGHFNSGHSFSPRGGGIRFGPGRIGSMLKLIIIANVLMFVVQQLVVLHQALGLTPALFFTDFPNRLYQPFTYMFLHSGFWHLAFNMVFVWMFGAEIEGIWGGRRFLRFYIFCGLGGAAFSLLFTASSMIPIIGASGALYGVMAAYWRYFPDRKLYLYFILPVKVRYFIPILLFLIPLLSIAFSSDTGIAHLAHLGGAVVGFFLTRRISDPSSPKTNPLTSFFRRRKEERLSAKFEANRNKAEDVMRRVDAILDKINEVGIENISAEDRKFLEQASEELSRNKRHQ